MTTRTLLTTTFLLLAWATVLPLAAGDVPAAPPASTPPSRPPPPPWAYVVDPALPAGATVPPESRTPERVPGSTRSFTALQLDDNYLAPDWFPGDHPAMPKVVAHGRAPDVAACGHCHLPTGLGRPENASLAGLPARYIEQQVADIRSGARTTSGALSAPHAVMYSSARALTDAEVHAAAAYFSQLRLTPWIRVVEAASVPTTKPSGFMLVPIAGGGVEPIGQRIIETAENLKLTELRDTRSGFVAYVPVGSISRGEALVTTGGGGKTLPCGICHGEDLKGLGAVPHLAGRSPSYLVRQLFDIQSGARRGPEVAPMNDVVARLGVDDMLAIAAYIASRSP